MATMLATAESGVQGRIREAQLKIREAEQGLEAVVHELSGAEDLLSQLQSERAQECIALALGRGRANPERFDRQIQATKDRISGLEDVKRLKEVAVTDCKVTLYELNDTVARIEDERAIHAEGEETRRLIFDIENSIETRNRSEKVIVHGIRKLRARRYLSETTRRIGADSAQRLERIANNMRP